MMRMHKGLLSLAVAGGSVLAVLAAAPDSRAQDSAGGISSVEISTEGRQVYVEVCQACHMADARGGGGAGLGIPALADNPRVADKAYLIGMLVNGQGGMPWFTDILTPQQIAAVLTYVRGNFNTYPEPVTADEVAAVIASAGGSAEQ